jgi:hypothetical protein
MSGFTPNLIDNPAAVKNPEKYSLVTVLLDKVLESWKISLFSFEWLLPSGAIRPPEQLPEREKEKYYAAYDCLVKNQPLERPILGIGVLDNVEIGSRRDVLLTLAAQDIETAEVHILKADKKEFTPYLAKDNA